MKCDFIKRTSDSRAWMLWYKPSQHARDYRLVNTDPPSVYVAHWTSLPAASVAFTSTTCPPAAPTAIDGKTYNNTCVAAPSNTLCTKAADGEAYNDNATCVATPRQTRSLPSHLEREPVAIPSTSKVVWAHLFGAPGMGIPGSLPNPSPAWANPRLFMIGLCSGPNTEHFHLDGIHHLITLHLHPARVVVLMPVSLSSAPASCSNFTRPES